jgi:S-DNA-T family DNA segregation ATPase FtsK/SpoIIIE
MILVRELRLWSSCAGAVLRAWPGMLCVLAAVGWLLRPMTVWVAAISVAVLIAIRAWALTKPRSFGIVVNPIRARTWRWRISRSWHNLCEECGLAAHGVPRLLRSTADWPHVQLRVRPAVGQTLLDYERSAEAMRLGVGATRVRVQFAGTRDVQLTLTVGDELRAAFDARVGAVVQLDSVDMGRREDGLPWRLAIGPQTLVAGCSGSGKGSVFWSLAFGLAPAVRDGRVQLHGIDLKGGMEIRMGSPLFTTTATNAAEAVVPSSSWSG